MINSGFWQKLPKPFFMLAPMADVTDAAFRRLIVKYSRPDVVYTEFVSCDGLCHPEGRLHLLKDLMYTEAERPIIAQLFGAKPENFYEAAKLMVELGFDGIDINMGCPARVINRQYAGAALIKQPELAREIIRATKAGAGDLPVSVKTRIGDTKNTLDTWLPVILEEEPAAVIIHARTRKEMSKVPAHWDAVKQAVDIAKGTGILIGGNGDVKDIADARVKAVETGADGIMLGRAIFGNPWLFDEKIVYEQIPITERLRVMVEHTKLFEELLGDVKPFGIMKKHYKAYVNGFDGAKELRVELMEKANTAAEVEGIVKKYLNSL
ncbi:MAG: tRNA-dihydrouridine synthase [Candidatus Buchananbacteria bacterium]|nr:tRNA-dihydrouridine synthase [Candidatus Buchananbacteria bacterium]